MNIKEFSFFVRGGGECCEWDLRFRTEGVEDVRTFSKS